MSRYLQVYKVELYLTKETTIQPTEIVTFSFLNQELGKKFRIEGGINIEVQRIYSEESIKETGKPEINEEFTIFNITTRTEIGKGKILEILVQE